MPVLQHTVRATKFKNSNKGTSCVEKKEQETPCKARTPTMVIKVEAEEATHIFGVGDNKTGVFMQNL